MTQKNNGPTEQSEAVVAVESQHHNKKKKPKKQARPAILKKAKPPAAETEIWPEPVDGEELIADIVRSIHRHLAVSEAALTAMALWPLFAHAFDAAETSPRLGFLSPMPECGKTTALTLLNDLVPAPLLVSNVTTAVIFRTIQRGQPTLLIDEADTYMDNNDEMRGILNSGHSRAAAYVMRCEGKDYVPTRFSTWTPMAIAKIGKLPDTLESRSIIIPMRRRRPDETVERFSPHRHSPDLHVLRRKAARWARDNLQLLKTADPQMPPGMSGRVADNWRPLCAIANTIGGTWPEKVRAAALELSHTGAEPSAGARLLAAIERALERVHSPWVASTTLCGLCATEDDALASLSPAQLARRLEPFGIRPKAFRDGIKAGIRGYRCEDFDDAFARYLPAKCNTATS